MPKEEKNIYYGSVYTTYSSDVDVAGILVTNIASNLSAADADERFKSTFLNFDIADAASAASYSSSLHDDCRT